jgi:hypothetical protein
MVIFYPFSLFVSQKSIYFAPELQIQRSWHIRLTHIGGGVTWDSKNRKSNGHAPMQRQT